MNETDQTAQDQKPKTQAPAKRAVNFSHRFDGESQGENFNVVDSISMMTSRALGILHLLSSQFEGGNDRLSDRLVCGALDAAIQEIEDIEATIMAFSVSEQNRQA